MAVNYNRDLQTFPLLKGLLNRITGSNARYQSPTDMGVNCLTSGFCDDAAIQQAAREEIIRRFFQYYAAMQSGQGDAKTFERIEEILPSQLAPEDRSVVKAHATALDCETAGKGDDGNITASGESASRREIISKNSPLCIQRR